MNKYVLPSAAAFLILVIAASSVMPVAAVRITLRPYLEVVTIAEDDQIREKGIMVLGIPAPAGWPKSDKEGEDFMAQYKISISLQGELVKNDESVLDIQCNVAEKDKITNPTDVTTGKTPTKYRQFPRENVETVVKEVKDWFKCKPRWKPGGLAVGVLDVYYIGAAADPAFIADHILVVHVKYKVGSQYFYGVDIQDLCILGWSMGENALQVTKAAGDFHWSWDNPLGDFASCEEAALWQLFYLGEWP